MLGNLRLVRAVRNLSQAFVAKEAALDRKYYRQLEAGLRPTRPEHIATLARVLDVDETLLLGGAIVVEVNGRVMAADGRLPSTLNGFSQSDG